MPKSQTRTIALMCSTLLVGVTFFVRKSIVDNILSPLDTGKNVGFYKPLPGLEAIWVLKFPSICCVVQE